MAGDPGSRTRKSMEPIIELSCDQSLQWLAARRYEALEGKASIEPNADEDA